LVNQGRFPGIRRPKYRAVATAGGHIFNIPGRKKMEWDSNLTLYREKAIYFNEI
jgi:hypothetical protein